VDDLRFLAHKLVYGLMGLVSANGIKSEKLPLMRQLFKNAEYLKLFKF